MKKLILWLMLALTPLCAFAEDTLDMTVHDDRIPQTTSVPLTVLPLSLPPVVDHAQTDTAAQPASGTWYDLTHEAGVNELTGSDVYLTAYVDKYDGDTLLWRAALRDHWVTDLWELPGGVLLWGTTYFSMDANNNPADWVSLLSHEGEVLWSHPVTEEQQAEAITAVLENGDASYTLFGTAGRNAEAALIVRHIGADGAHLDLTVTPLADLGAPLHGAYGYYVREAIPCGEGYLLRIFGVSLNDPAQFHLVRMSRDGSVTQTLHYQSRGVILTLQDMHLQGDTLWLSGYIVPQACYEGAFYSTRCEISDVLDELFRRYFGTEVDLGLFSFTVGRDNTNSSWLTPRLRQNYTALLLRCDAATGHVQAAFTAQGCMGGNLTDAPEGLAWDVSCPIFTHYSPLTSSYTIDGEAAVTRCIFDAQGLVRMNATEERVSYLR